MAEIQTVESIPVTCRSLNTDEGRSVEKGTYKDFQAIVQVTQDGATRVLCPKLGNDFDKSKCRAKSGITQDSEVTCPYVVGPMKEKQ